MKRTLFLAAFAVILTGVSVYYFAFLRDAGPPETTVHAAEQSTVKTDIVAAPGIVEAISEEIEVGAEVAGKLREVPVEEGESVEKGTVVAIIENADYATAVQTARAQVETLRSAQESARARLGQARADHERIVNGSRVEERREARFAYEQTLPNVENSRREFERSERLYRSGDVSREEFERAQTAYENARKQSATVQERYNVVNAPARADDLARADAAIHIAESNVREFDAQIAEASARVAEAEARFEKTVIRSPIAGVVLRKRLKGGESVSPESPTGIVTIADTSSLRIRIDLDETDVARVRVGQAAFVTADAYDGKKFDARVIEIGQILGRKNFRTERPTEKVDTKILEVLLELAPGERLPLGLRVDAFVTAVDRN